MRKHITNAVAASAGYTGGCYRSTARPSSCCSSSLSSVELSSERNWGKCVSSRAPKAGSAPGPSPCSVDGHCILSCHILLSLSYISPSEKETNLQFNVLLKTNRKPRNPSTDYYHSLRSPWEMPCEAWLEWTAVQPSLHKHKPACLLAYLTFGLFISLYLISLILVSILVLMFRRTLFMNYDNRFFYKDHRKIVCVYVYGFQIQKLDFILAFNYVT